MPQAPVAPVQVMSPMVIKELVIQNDSFKDVDHVELWVGKTQNSVKVNRILPQSRFSNGMRGRVYQANTFKVSWVYDRVAYTADNLKISGVSENYRGREVAIIISINGANVKVYIKPFK